MLNCVLMLMPIGDVQLGWQRWRWTLFVFLLEMEMTPERDGHCIAKIQDHLLSNPRDEGESLQRALQHHCCDHGPPRSPQSSHMCSHLDGHITTHVFSRSQSEIVRPRDAISMSHIGTINWERHPSGRGTLLATLLRLAAIFSQGGAKL